MARIVALFALIGVALAGTDNVSPVQKVIELLEENKLKILNDLKAEETEMAEYSTYCDDETKERGYAIKTSDSKIAELEATIEDGEAQLVGLTDEIATIGTELANKDKDLAAASSVRKAEKADFEASEKELVGSVDQLERAIVMIKRGTAFVQSGSAQSEPKKAMKAAMKVFAEIIDAGRVNAGLRKKLQNLVQTATDAGEDSYQKLGQPQAKVSAYESSSGGILGQLTEMKEKAEETLSDTRMAEMRGSHNFDTFSQSLTDAIKISNDKLASAKKSAAAMTEANGKAKGELVETQKTKAADEAFLATLTSDCKEAEASWAERQESAKGELSAIAKAKAILSEGVRVLLQTGHKSPVDDDSDAEDAVPETPQDKQRQRIVQKLKALGSKLNSYALMELAGAAAADPFEKVKGLITDMIAKLVNEANEEATQKGFCDEETSKGKASQEEKSLTIDQLQSRLDKASSAKAQLEQNVKELQKEIAELDKGTAESTKLRAEEKATYEKASKDFKDAADAVEKAIKVLKEYYEASLLQTGKQDRAAKTGSKQPAFGEAKSEASHAIISILEMSGEGFTKMLMEAETEESEAQKSYEDLMQDNKVSKTAKQAEIKGALSEIKSLDVALKNHKEDYDMTSKELAAVMAYLEKLKPQCETKAMSYQEKKARRESEISGLKEALSILEGGVLVQTKSQLRGVQHHA